MGTYFSLSGKGRAVRRGGRLFEAGRLLNFAILSECSRIFCNKTINANNKKGRCNKARFLYNTTLKKTPSSGGSLIISYWSFCGREWGGVGAYSRLGAY